MTKSNPIAIIVGMIVAPFILVYDLIIGRTIALFIKIGSVIWYCYIDLPVKLGEFTEKLQLIQLGFQIIDNLTSQSLVDGAIHSISPLSGIVGILLCGWLFYCLREIIFEAINQL